VLLVPVDPGEQVVEVGGGELPLEGPGGGVVARLEVGESLPDLVEAGEVVRRHDLALYHRGRRLRFVLRDRDAKFSPSCDDVFAADGTQILKTPVRAPNANAHAERWIRTVRAECLDWLLILGRGHLEQVLQVYVEHYNAYRAHRALGLQPPDPTDGLALTGVDQPCRVHRRDLLGGLVYEYRQAA
jgi:putative transposase